VEKARELIDSIVDEKKGFSLVFLLFINLLTVDTLPKTKLSQSERLIIKGYHQAMMLFHQPTIFIILIEKSRISGRLRHIDS